MKGYVNCLLKYSENHATLYEPITFLVWVFSQVAYSHFAVIINTNLLQPFIQSSLTYDISLITHKESDTILVKPCSPLK